ncbi:MAG: ABC transporter permease, partial [Anaerolineae bacterium]
MARRSERRKREGSPWTGVGAVMAKEMADHLTSVRMQILELLIVLTAAGTGYVALQNLQTGGNRHFLFLQLFSTGKDPLPSFAGFLSFLVPVIAIAMAFDAINGEFNRRTFSRVLSQPIYRDSVLLGKFLAGLFTLALVLAAIWLLIFGIGLIGLGVPPTSEETGRAVMFLLVTIAYGAFWLALGMLFSIVFRQPATAAMASFAVWLFFMLFWNMIVSLIGNSILPIRYGLLEEVLARANLELMLSRLSPNTLFVEATVALLDPTVRSLGIILPFQLQGALLGAPLPLGQSIVLMWPHFTVMIAV